VGWWNETSRIPHRETLGHRSEVRIHALEMSTWRMDIASRIWFWIWRRPKPSLSIRLACMAENPPHTPSSDSDRNSCKAKYSSAHPELMESRTYCLHVRLWRRSKSLRVNSERLQICKEIKKMKRHVGPYHLRRMGRVARRYLRVADQSSFGIAGRITTYESADDVSNVLFA
jgi:hypothetical protein